MSETPSSRVQPGLPVHRVEALTDALFAIVMTLLVLSIEVPNIPDGRVDSELTGDVLDLWPQFFSYFLTFTILGFHWVAHHNIYHYLRFSNRTLIWLNFAYLMFIALLPFSTNLIGDYPREQISVLLYGGNLLLVSLFLELQWWYASHGARLIDPNMPPRAVRQITFRTFISPTGFIIALAVSFISTELSIAVFVLILLTHLVVHYITMRRLRAAALEAGRAYVETTAAPSGQPAEQGKG
jgi:uncharacterized membrane protein